MPRAEAKRCRSSSAVTRIPLLLTVVKSVVMSLMARLRLFTFFRLFLLSPLSNFSFSSSKVRRVKMEIGSIVSIFESLIKRNSCICLTNVGGDFFHFGFVKSSYRATDGTTTSLPWIKCLRNVRKYLSSYTSL